MNNNFNNELVVAGVVELNGVKIPERILNGQRVFTVHDIALVHRKTDRAIRINFSRRRSQFVEGEDYFIINSYSQFDQSTSYNIVPSPRGAIYFTVHGYGILIKGMHGEEPNRVYRDSLNAYMDTNTVDDSYINGEVSDYTSGYNNTIGEVIKPTMQRASTCTSQSEHENTIAKANKVIAKVYYAVATHLNDRPFKVPNEYFISETYYKPYNSTMNRPINDREIKELYHSIHNKSQMVTVSIVKHFGICDCTDALDLINMLLFDDLVTKIEKVYGKDLSNTRLFDVEYIVKFIRSYDFPELYYYDGDSVI